MRLPAAVIATAALTLAACGGGSTDDTSSGGGECDEAWQAAAEVSDFQDTLEDLHPAFRACGSYEEWAAASERHPSVLDGVDPLTYATNQCQSEAVLAGTPVCTSLPS